MKFDFRKLLTTNKALPKEPIHNVTIGELARFFERGTAPWNKTGELEQYHKSLYVFAAVNKIAMKISAVELNLYQIQGVDGNDKQLFQHPALDIIARPNPYQTRSEFLRTAWINKKLTGEAFWWKVRNKRGQVVELWNLRPDFMTIVSDPTSFIKQYEFNKGDGTKSIFDPEDVIYFKDPDPTSVLRGMSPLQPAKSRIETEHSTSEYQRDFFRNNARPDALLITEETLDTEQRTQMTSSWEERHKGEDNTSKIGILEGGMKYQQVSISQKEMDYVESSKFNRDEILIALGVPKSVITTDAVTYNNADAGILMFLSETIVPEMEQLIEVLNEFLISLEFGEDLYLDFINPTPDDKNAILAENTAGFAKWLTVNEIRETYNLPSIKGGDVIAVEGTTLSKPESSGPAPSAAPDDISPDSGDPNPPPSTRTFVFASKKPSRRNSHRNLQGKPILRKRFELMGAAIQSLKDQKEYLLKTRKTELKNKTKGKGKKTKDYVSLFEDKEIRQAYYEMTDKRIEKRSKSFKKTVLTEAASQEGRAIKNLKKVVKKSKGAVVYEKAGVDKIIDKGAEAKLFADFTLPFLVEFATSGGEDAATLTGETFNFRDSLTKILTKRSSFFGDSVTDTTHKRLVATLTDGIDKGEGIKQLTDRVKGVYNDYPDWRAGTVARTETTYANNQGAIDHYKQSDVVQGKEWISTFDSRTRDSHADIDGEIVGVEENFSNGLEFPGDGNGEAKETINCRCAVAPALFGDKAIAPKKLSSADTVI